MLPPGPAPMALLICSLLMGLQSVPGIIKPYSKGVVQFLTKVPEKQKSKDSTLLPSTASSWRDSRR